MSILSHLKNLYPNDYQETYQAIQDLIQNGAKKKPYEDISEKDVMLITYGDSIKKENEAPLKTLHHFLNTYTESLITNVHILPMFPYTSDDGFSVVDYLKIDPALGSWEDIKTLSLKRGLMFDAVINHISKSSPWFLEYLKGNKAYKDYFITCDSKLDYSSVTRPRALPLYYTYETHEGEKYIWATFSNDQVDLNYKNPKVLIDILEVLIQYALKGARFIRFDAVGFLWKELGTASIHLKETHMLVQIMRDVLDQAVPGTKIITETNVPHKENISYFGDGTNEAHMVYQFPLPPLTLHTFVSEDATKLSLWAKSLDDTPLSETTTYFNFLASHDGIGMRPVEDILNDEEKQTLVDHVLNNDGQIGYRVLKDGSKSPYELNINYMDAITKKEDSLEVKRAKFMASQVILLSFKGLPGIYIHSLLGSKNDLEGLKSSGINRRINREKLWLNELENSLQDPYSDRTFILTTYLNLIKIRQKETAFNPYANQTVNMIHPQVFSITRTSSSLGEKIDVFVNVSSQKITLPYKESGFDLIEKCHIDQEIILNPYQYRWVKVLT